MGQWEQWVERGRGWFGWKGDIETTRLPARIRGRNDMRVWASAVASLIVLLIAGLFWSVGPASECSTSQELTWLAGLPFFAVSVACGTYVIAVGDRRQRLTVFLSFAVVWAGYVWGLAQSLPLVFGIEISCAAEGARPLH